jgi:hypothetical protein
MVDAIIGRHKRALPDGDSDAPRTSLEPPSNLPWTSLEPVAGKPLNLNVNTVDLGAAGPIFISGTTVCFCHMN